MSETTPSQSKSKNVSTDAHPAGKERPSRLMTFKEPQPSARLIRFLVPINRWLHLGGIPGLRSIPGLGRVPGIRGLMNIPNIDFPKVDEERLRDATSPKNACFITPNHPEFFTDWMLDKEIMTRVAPRAASWATHDVVNGLGKTAQKFWLKNNLIAQIPGAGGAKGKAYSIDWALAGHNVLLHPEGGVGWHGDLVAPLFSGAVDMACEAARRAEKGRRVLLAPVVWKLKFNRNVEPALNKEFDYIERSLNLPLTSKSDGLEQRLYSVYNTLLSRAEIKHGMHPTSDAYFERQDRLVVTLHALLADKLDYLSVEPANDNSTNEQIRRAARWMRKSDKASDEAKEIRDLTKAMRLLLRFHKGIYAAQQLSQEHIAESIKRIRNDYCKGTTRDSVNAFIPQPAGPRTAYIRIPEPLDVGALMEATSVQAMLDDLQARMQMALDSINTELAAKDDVIFYPNPFAS